MTKKISVNRRNFLKTTVLGATSSLIPASIYAQNRVQEKNENTGLIMRKLGNTGIELPIVSMGVMRADIPALVKTALNRGIEHFDTAHVYQNGKNEEMLGEVLSAYPRESFILGTKILSSPNNIDEIKTRDAEELKQELKDKFSLSLERLKIDYVDILYLHSVKSSEHALYKPILEVLKEIKESGQALHLGLSTHRNEPEVIQAAADSGVYEVVLTAYNFMQSHRNEMDIAIANAAAKGLGIIAMKTMAGGFLDKEKTKPINCKAALKWAMKNENITTSIPGITSFEQLIENNTINSDAELTEEEKQYIEEIQLHAGLYCDGCEECMAQCPKKLPIPDIMRAYMYAYGYSDLKKAKDTLHEFSFNIEKCQDCETCSIICKKGFAVAQKMADINRVKSIPSDLIA